MRAKFISADGLEKIEEIYERAPCIQRACFSPARLLSADPSVCSVGATIRSYELYSVERDQAGYPTAIYRERLSAPPPPRDPPITTGELARALFESEHDAEAFRLAEGRVDQVKRVLDVMWIRTKRVSRDECIGRAAALLGRIRTAR